MHETTPSLRERTPGAVGASWTAQAWAAFRASLAETLRPTPFVLGGVAGLFLAYLGPFGSDTASLAQRYVYWPGVIVGGTLLGVMISCAIDAVFDRARRRPILSTLLTAVVLTPVGALFVMVVTRAMFGAQVMSYGALLGPVFLLSLAMTGLNHLAERRRHPVAGPEVAAPPAASTPPPVRFLERLPLRLRGADLHAIEAQDHYLRLHTSRGSDLILMRLSDAILELDGLDGAQTHRSWWVARAAVAAVRKGDGRAVLVLTNGVEAPVSRSFLPTLRDQGWI